MVRATVLAAAAVLALGLTPAAGARTAPAPTPAALHRAGSWLVDGQGRVVILHGVNAVWKRAPYLPPATPGGFTARDADWIAAQGFNTVRLGVLFAGVMPRPGYVDPHYLEGVTRLVRVLAARRIWVLLDFHQDLYSERFSGEGFPDWAVHDDGVPHAVDAGFPGNYFLPATMRAFDNFWANTAGVQERYAAAWAAVARHVRDEPYVLGYDVMNEPWPGVAWPSCANPLGCPVFDARSLQPLYDRVAVAIRSVDRRHLVYVEPNVLYNDGARTGLGSLGSLGDQQLDLSFHQYCTTAGLTHSHGGKAGPDCGPQGDLVFANAAADASRLPAAPLLTEFGASDDLPDIARVVTGADTHLMGWQYWHYKEWADPTTESQGSGGQGLFTDDRSLATVKPAKADVLVRPYARAVAGIPTSMGFDPSTRRFTLTYQAHPEAGVTEVVLPRRQYPHSYRVTVSGASVVSANGAGVLLLRAAASGQVTLAVSPP